MAEEKVFANGLIFKLPADTAPDFAKGSLSIKLEEFIPWLQQNANEGWVNIDLNVSRGGKPYGQLNTYRRTRSSGGGQSYGDQGGYQNPPRNQSYQNPPPNQGGYQQSNHGSVYGSAQDANKGYGNPPPPPSGPQTFEDDIPF